MVIFDVIVGFILFFFFLSSLFKGMIREIFSFLGYLTGYIAAINYNDQLALAIQSMVAQEIIARITGFAIIFIIVKIIVSLIIFLVVKFLISLVGRMIKQFMNGTAVLSLPDRILGGVLGLLKGIVFTAIIIFPISLFEEVYDDLTNGSVLAPYFEKIVEGVSQGSYKTNIINKLPKVPINSFKKHVDGLGDIEKLSKEIIIKKDNLIKSIEDLTLKNKSQENYTDADKSDLNKLLNSFSDK